jgi:hypothetical protein
MGCDQRVQPGLAYNLPILFHLPDGTWIVAMAEYGLAGAN